MVSFQKKSDSSIEYKMGLEDSTSNFVISQNEENLLIINNTSGDVVIKNNLKVN